MGVDEAVIQLVTRCNSADEFIERFARFTSKNDVVVPAVPHVSAGTSGRFVIRLKDQSVIMAGRCEVSEVLPMAVAPGAPPRSARALMRLRLIEMDAHSCGIHLRLIERGASSVQPPSAPAPAPAPPPRPAAPSLSIVRTPPPAVPAPASSKPVMAPAAPPPVRSAPAPTLIGLSAPVRAAAAAIVAAEAPPVDSEATEISPLPQPETRVPGAALTLPANPLSDLDAADLGSFIEHRLHETEGVDNTAIVRIESIERARRLVSRGWPYASCVLVGLVVGLSLRSGTRRAPVVAAPPVVSRSEIAPPPAPPAVAPAAAAEGASGAPRACVARVTTTPAGAAVFWGDVALGPSPIEHAAIRCGSATVTVRHERYADVTRTITAERGRATVVSERLNRPPAKLLVTSSPPHAIIKVNRKAFGSAPRRIGTLRFEHVRIEASLPGYRPWAKTLYLKGAETTVDVTLAPVSKPNARRAAASPVPPARGLSSPPR